jgi:hypothetical protein
MEDSIKTVSSNKIGFKAKLITMLGDIGFYDHISEKLRRIDNLLSSLKDDVWFFAEYPYIDRHYRDTYYSFHSAKFRETKRNCVRVHIFSGKMFSSDDFIDNREVIKDNYLGFFVIRPLPNFPLGRSLISPKAFKKNDFVCCLMSQKVSIFGISLKAYGFPHVAQDTETHSCAESSLWSFIEYFGSKYSSYKPLLPSQIVKSLLNITEHRLLPSMGLTENELARCLHDNGFQCLKYNINRAKALYELIKIYLESGIPLLLLLSNEVAAHATLVIGHENDESNYKVPIDRKWTDVSFFDKNLVFIDDNMPPYQIAHALHPTEHYPDKKLQNLKIWSFIVPLPSHTFLVAEKVYALLNCVFGDPTVGFKDNTKWITRMLLTGANSFKNFIIEYDDKLSPKMMKYLLHLDLPKFIWICEIYHEKDFANHISSGLIIIDATAGSKSLVSILLYMLDTKMYLHDNFTWTGALPIDQFNMCAYRNNLKGEWNEWKS